MNHLCLVNRVLKRKAPTVTLLSIAAAIAVVVLLSVDSEGRPGTAQASLGTVDVAVGRNFFGTTGSGAWNGSGDPGTFEETTIQVGDSVSWKPWRLSHTVTGCDPNTFWVDCSGDAPIGTKTQSSGSYGPITFSTAGEYPYLCLIHPSNMRGKIVVLAAPTPAVTSTPTPTPTPSPMPPPTLSPTPTPAPTATPPPIPTALGAVQLPDTGGDQGGEKGDTNRGLVLVLAASAVAVTAAAWYARRRWLR